MSRGIGQRVGSRMLRRGRSERMGSATVRWQAMTEEQSPSRVASPEIDARKKLLRARISELRGQVGRKRAWEAGRAMAHLLARNPLFEAADSTALFSALGDEPDTRPLFDLLRREGRRVFFPRCRQDGGLDLFRVDAWRDLVPRGAGSAFSARARFCVPTRGASAERRAGSAGGCDPDGGRTDSRQGGTLKASALARTSPGGEPARRVGRPGRRTGGAGRAGRRMGWGAIRSQLNWIVNSKSCAMAASISMAKRNCASD